MVIRFLSVVRNGGVKLRYNNPDGCAGFGAAPVLGLVSSAAGLLNLGMTGINMYQIHKMSKKLGKMDSKLDLVLVRLEQLQALHRTIRDYSPQLASAQSISTQAALPHDVCHRFAHCQTD